VVPPADMIGQVVAAVVELLLTAVFLLVPEPDIL
jgi:hypothetical protein